MSEIQKFVFDWTINCEDDRKDELIRHLDLVAKKWAFQLECGKTGNRHYQGRMDLKERKRKSTLVKERKGTPMKGAHYSLTSDKGAKSFTYVITTDKEGKVLDGPWMDEKAMAKIPKMPYEVEYMGKNGLRPFQQSITDDFINQQDPDRSKHDRKHINCVVDPFGLLGKTWLGKYLMWHKHCLVVPAYDDMTKMMGYVASFDSFKVSGVLVDMPRGLDQHKLKEFWAGIEVLKGGIIADWRNKTNAINGDQLCVWVIGNTAPPMNRITAGRFKVWMIDPKSFELIVWTPMRHEKAWKIYKAKQDKEESKEPTDLCSFDNSDEEKE